jgi:hypothetical protein
MEAEVKHGRTLRHSTARRDLICRLTLRAPGEPSLGECNLSPSRGPEPDVAGASWFRHPSDGYQRGRAERSMQRARAVDDWENA